MNLSTKCSDYIELHTINPDVENEILKRLSQVLPLTVSSSIDWATVINAEEIVDVDADKLKISVLKIAHKAKIDCGMNCVVIQLNSAIPTLLTTINDWIKFCEELNFVDTIFISKNCSWVIHWDFYKDLHALNISA